MGKIVYIYKGSIYINLTNRCVTNCIFCNKAKLQKKVNSKLWLKKEPTAKEVIERLKDKINKGEEVVFCGIGDPLIKLKELLEITRYIKDNYRKKVRINTTGLAKFLYPKTDVAGKLNEAGIGSIHISLNTHHKEDYNAKMRPRDKDSFTKVIDFVKDCKKANIKVTLTFVDKDIDKEECKKLAKKLKVSCIFRPYL